MSIELKPCPFCGGEARLVKIDQTDERFVVCGYCGLRTNFYGDERNAIYAWNKRAQSEFTPDELDAIRRMFADRYPRGRKLPEIEQSIIDKCANALKGGKE